MQYNAIPYATFYPCLYCCCYHAAVGHSFSAAQERFRGNGYAISPRFTFLSLSILSLSSRPHPSFNARRWTQPSTENTNPATGVAVGGGRRHLEPSSRHPGPREHDFSREVLLGPSSQSGSSGGDSSGGYDGGEIRLNKSFSGFVGVATNNAAPRDDRARHRRGYSGSNGQEIVHVGSRNEMSEAAGASPARSSDYG